VTQLQSTRYAGAMAPKHRCTPWRTGSSASKRLAERAMHADDFRIGVFHGDEDIGPTLPDGDRLRHVRSPHLLLAVALAMKAGGGYLLADMAR